MTHIVEIIILHLLAIAVFYSLRRLWRTIQALRRRELLSDDIAGCCESLGYIGCSAICSAGADLSHIERLLDVEYDRYEVIVVLDSDLERALFCDIVSRYRLIRVNCPTSDELPSATMRSLYRSRQRSFRRLILIDRCHSTLYDDLDAALSVASYQYVIPIGRNSTLCQHAIESIAIKLSEPENRNCELLYSTTSHTFVFQREAVVRRGGFSPRILRRATPFERLDTYLPLIYSDSEQETINFLYVAAIFLLIGALILVEALLISNGVAVATAVTLAMVLLAAMTEQRLCSPANCSTGARISHIRRIIGIFNDRNFVI